jgi:uncharacterized damage-inducible protein DinB
MSGYAFLVETYRTERLKILGVWSQVPDDRMGFRPEPRARTPLEHMVHQCQSEDGWMRSMLGIDISQPVLPAVETRDEFIRHYAVCSDDRLRQLDTQPDSWFEAPASFFGEARSRAWVLTRRMTHSAHHRGQLTMYLRLWGQALYSTYGPTADTGGLPKNGARVVYPFESLEELFDARGQVAAALPGPGDKPPTERGDT